MLTYENLHAHLMYNPWTGDFYRKKATIRCSENTLIGFKDDDGYIIIHINGKQYKAHRLAWFYVHGYMPENDIDHENRITNHNWIKNLRETSRQCNSRNTSNPKNNTSSVKGVGRDGNNSKWASSLMLDQKNKFLGRYKEFDNAVCARLAGEQCVGWEGCDIAVQLIYM